jgi:hypothetical protein
MDTALLNKLLGDVEEGWRDRRDRNVAYRLAETHPDYREELLEFFDDLVLGPETPVSADVREAESRVSDWIQSNGIVLGVAAAARSREGGSTTKTTPSVTPLQPVENTDATTSSTPKATPEATTWVLFLKRRLNRRVPELAAVLPHVSTEYLVLASRHPNLLPDTVRKTLAAYVEDSWHVSVAESMLYLEGQPKLSRAASRTTPFESEPASFQELLDRAALTPEQKAFWLDHSEGG